MGNFEKLSVLVIVVIIVMILVVAIYVRTDNPDQSATTGTPPETFARGDNGQGAPGASTRHATAAFSHAERTDHSTPSNAAYIEFLPNGSW